MKSLSPLGRIRTLKNIRTRHSVRLSTGPGRGLWPRLKETEQLQFEEKRLRARRRVSYCLAVERR